MTTLTSSRRMIVLYTSIFMIMMAPAVFGAEPGVAYPAASEASDQKAGSVLFYPFYTSGAVNPAMENSRISMTNSSVNNVALVHIFFVANSCAVSDAFICLTANQTVTFLTSDFDPGLRGYFVAVAVDFQGNPLNHNYLTGDVHVKLASGHEGTLPAVAFAALYAGSLPPSSDGVTATLFFDGVSYNRAPAMVAIDKLRSSTDGNSTLLVLNRFGGSLVIGGVSLGVISGVIYDDMENQNTFTFSGGCQFTGTLSDTFPLINPVYSSFIPSGRSGWMKLYSISNLAIIGAVLNFNPSAGGNGSAFIGGHNLRILSLASSASYVIPVFSPSC